MNADFSAARQDAHRSLKVEADVELLGWMARFVPEKAPGAVLRALAEGVTDRQQLHADLIGDSPLRDEQQTVSPPARLERRVTFAGLTHDAHELYAAFEVLVHGSRCEGQRRVVQQGIAERRPVIARRVAGWADLVPEGVIGYIVEPQDQEDLGRSILRPLERGPRAPLNEYVVEKVAATTARQMAAEGHPRLYRQLLGAAA